MPDRTEWPFITVCMPVRNEARFIQNTLVQLLAQDYPRDRYEIIVADGESDDGTQDIVRLIAGRFPQVILKNNPKRLSSAGRNIGFKTGKGDIFLVVDGHCYIPTGKLFKNIVHCFEKSGADCLGRPQPLDPPDITPFQKAVALARHSRIGHGEDSLIYSDYEGFVSPVSNGAVYKRHVFEKIGFVNESFDACEDVEFNVRVEKAGLKTFMSSAIAVKYYPRESSGALLRQLVRYGRGRYQLARKHPDTLSIIGLMPLFFVLGLLVLAPATAMVFFAENIFWFLILLMVIIPYGLYVILLLIVPLKMVGRNGGMLLIWLPPIFFIIHFALGWGFIREAIEWNRI